MTAQSMHIVRKFISTEDSRIAYSRFGGTLVALCGLGALAGYALGRNQAAFGVMGKPARGVRRLAQLG